MKYLISKKIRIGDFNYFIEHYFIENYEGEFVGEHSLERIVAVAEEEKVWKLVDGSGLKPASSVLSDLYMKCTQAIKLSVDVRRGINSVASKRTGKEVIVTNY